MLVHSDGLRPVLDLPDPVGSVVPPIDPDFQQGCSQSAEWDSAPEDPFPSFRTSRGSHPAVVGGCVPTGIPKSGPGGPGLDIFPMGWGSEVLICPICLAWVVGGRLWLTGFPLCFCEKYGKLARTDLKNERILRSGGFQACYEIIRGVVGGLTEFQLKSQYKYF
jgi:hypothetical protein